MTFQKGDHIDSRYTVVFPLGEWGSAELYRVRNSEGRLCYLKFFSPGDNKEIEMRRQLVHPCVCAFIDSGTWEDHPYMVTEFVSCETLADNLRRRKMLPVAEARQMTLALLRLLRVLHGRGVVHTAISAESVWINLTGETADIRLTDFSRAHQSEDVQDDLYAVGKLLFLTVYGMSPTVPLRLPNIAVDDMDDRLLKVMGKALASEREQQFHSADEFIKALVGQTDIADTFATTDSTGKGVQRRRGNGFADVAGMDELKKLLYEDVLYVLRDKEKAQRYRLTIPNGMLLYGPPGCGKTFISERFAEEAGYNYQFVKSSDLASVYIHGTQEKIGELFREARAKAPTVLCFDEFEALVPRRNNLNNANMSGEVNEFLTQLNNCGHDGVFVIATTNQPLLIDEAVLRRGRIDHIIYVPLPDEKARLELFRIHLKGRPCSADIRLERLAQQTDNYIASEIAFIVNQAALRASHADADISQKLLENVISETKPRTTQDIRDKYENMRRQMNQERTERRRIGF